MQTIDGFHASLSVHGTTNQRVKTTTTTTVASLFIPTEIGTQTKKPTDSFRTASANQQTLLLSSSIPFPLGQLIVRNN